MEQTQMTGFVIFNTDFKLYWTGNGWNSAPQYATIFHYRYAADIAADEFNESGNVIVRSFESVRE